MTNPFINPQPNYSGVTIQIANPAVNVAPNGGYCNCNSGNTQYSIPNATPYAQQPQYMTNPMQINNAAEQGQEQSQKTQTGYPNAYPAQYYLNNYNYQNNVSDSKKQEQDNAIMSEQEKSENVVENADNKALFENNQTNPNAGAGIANKYSNFAKSEVQQEADLTTSQNIIGDIENREATIKEEKRNTKETKIVALTDEYIKSLENYLNNPNQEIRLMASKEILTRLDEDKERYDDAALNALLNKMLQDPSKLIRVAALSAFASQLASGNDYTVQLLHNIQSNPNADKEDVLQAADILLKMSAGTEIKNIPNPKVKENPKQEQ